MDDPRRKAQRRQVGLVVKPKHPTLAGFAEAFATNVSAGGMFLRSRTPQPVGTRVTFEVRSQVSGPLRQAFTHHAAARHCA